MSHLEPAKESPVYVSDIERDSFSQSQGGYESESENSSEFLSSDQGFERKSNTRKSRQRDTSDKQYDVEEDKKVPVPPLCDVDTDTKKRDRWWDKVQHVSWFAFVVLEVVAVSSSEWRALVPWIFCIAYPPLVCYRYYQYKPRKWEMFLLDWCYMVNVVVMVFLIGFPDPLLSSILFYAAFANLPWAVSKLRNSMVFYSTDRMTSLYIHTMPMATLFSVRFFPEDTGRLWHHTFVSDPESAAASLGAFLSIPGIQDPVITLALFLPIFVSLCFLVYHSLSSAFVFSLRLPPSYLTLYRMSLENEPKYWQQKLLDICGERSRPVLYTFWSTVFEFKVLLPCVVFYLYRPVAIAFALYIVLLASWNGAGFLMEYHSIRYAAKPPNKRVVELTREEYEKLVLNQR
eukprot:CAMPEP_0184548678 /NCGR_PEP_ID=MMETSP0199_2-20130426/6347_1 /TAXON_ID=1112570 /ORGANISM="Thraustochytrium sp., Strain LLF1b" /LENGTH=401 /DNA_ID=CAMNT_0026943311 /DNA_START=157 /DNA_END=1362 /DNA_ORIENTATION=-